MPHSNTSLELHWQPPDKDTWNGPLLGYTIEHRIFGYFQSPFHAINVSDVNGLNPSYELRGLAYFEEYEVRVAAFNIKGTGVFSNILRVSMFLNFVLAIAWAEPHHYHHQVFINEHVGEHILHQWTPFQVTG